MTSQKATMRQLAALIAPTLNITQAEAEKRIKDLFALTARLLQEGDSVEIDRLGVFSLSEGNLLFTPDHALAQAINAPFQPFQPVELADDVDPAMLDDTADPEPSQESEPEPQQDTEFQPEPEPETEFQPEPEPEPEPQPEPQPEETVAPEELPVEVAATEEAEIHQDLQFPQDEEEYFVQPVRPAKKSGIPTWVWIIFSFLVGVAIGFGAYFYCVNLGLL